MAGTKRRLSFGGHDRAWGTIAQSRHWNTRDPNDRYRIQFQYSHQFTHHIHVRESSIATTRQSFNHWVSRCSRDPSVAQQWERSRGNYDTQDTICAFVVWPCASELKPFSYCRNYIPRKWFRLTTKKKKTVSYVVEKSYVENYASSPLSWIYFQVRLWVIENLFLDSAVRRGKYIITQRRSSSNNSQTRLSVTREKQLPR